MNGKMMDKSSTMINGFLVINKPRGLTSMDVVRRAKRLTGQRKRVGHGGTLDPLAEGVLPICFGQATRLMEYLFDGDKHYEMEIRLGVSTDTHDAEGIITYEHDTSHITRQHVEDALASFQGVIYQTPPMHSAIKIGGKRLYELARQGLEVEREARKVEIKSLELVDFQLPAMVVNIKCGRGVYMRSLAHDLGEVLGCGAHVSVLTRLKCGPFNHDEAVTLEMVQRAVDDNNWEIMIHPVDSLLLNMKSAVVEENDVRMVRNGQPINLGQQGFGAKYLESYRLYTKDGNFLAVVRFNKARNRWDPYKVFQLGNPSPFAPA